MDEKDDALKKILRECENNQLHVTKDLIFFLISLYELNPNYQIEDTNKVDYDIIIQAIVQRLVEKSPNLIALKNQLYYVKHYQEREEIIKRYRLCLHQKTTPLVNEICETDQVHDDKDIERLYQKILVVITLLSGLGNPTNPCILREVSVALQSVFQPSELTYYVTLKKYEKEQQLMELMCIVAGIRLFNKDNQRSGEGIDDLPNILQAASNRTHRSILEMLEKIMQKVYKLTTVVENSCYLMLNETSDDDCYCWVKKEEDLTTKDKQWAIEMLTASRQEEIYIRKLLNNIEECETEIKNLIERLQNRLLKLHDTVRYRTAVPTAQVYPQFIDLADIWLSLQDEVIVLSSINTFLEEFHNLSITILHESTEIKLNKLLGDKKISSDADRLERTMGKVITECGDCLLYYPDMTKDFENINLEFLGFCAWSFVVCGGTLIPGNPNNGVAKWRGKYYAFSSIPAAEKFGRNPDKYVYEALQFIRKHPEYIHLFQLQEIMEATKNQDKLAKEGPQLKICRDQNTQTDVHILPPHIDKNYTSNIWDLRRNALKLATLSQCTTHSTQTHLSNFRYGIHVQAAPSRDKEVQTRRDNYMNTKKLKTFIFGLRGRRDDCQHVVSFLESELEHL